MSAAARFWRCAAGSGSRANASVLTSAAGTARAGEAKRERKTRICLESMIKKNAGVVVFQAVTDNLKDCGTDKRYERR